MSDFSTELASQYEKSLVSIYDVSESYTWGAVSGYIAGAAGAVAGLLMWRFGGFWTRIAGYVVGGVGVTAMGVIFAVWQFSPDWKVFQNFVIETYKLYNNCRNIYVNLSDAQKRDKFLSELTEYLKKCIKENPETSTQYNMILSYIDSGYLGFKSFEDAFIDVWNYYISITDFASKTISVTAATASVVVVAYCSGFCGMMW